MEKTSKKCDICNSLSISFNDFAEHTRLNY